MVRRMESTLTRAKPDAELYNAIDQRLHEAPMEMMELNEKVRGHLQKLRDALLKNGNDPPKPIPVQPPNSEPETF